MLMAYTVRDVLIYNVYLGFLFNFFIYLQAITIKCNNFKTLERFSFKWVD